MVSDRTRRILGLAGNILSLLAIVFIGERLYSYHGQLDAQQAAALALPVLLFSVVYAASCMLPALAWRGILAALIAARIVSVLGDLLFYGAAQFAGPKKRLVS